MTLSRTVLDKINVVVHGRSGEYARDCMSAEELADTGRRAKVAGILGQSFASRSAVARMSTPLGNDEQSAVLGAGLMADGADPTDVGGFLKTMLARAASISEANLAIMRGLVGDDVAFTSSRANCAWALNGFPLVNVTDSKFAASLMATRVPCELAELTVPPWSTFRIALPPDLVTLEAADDSEHVARIDVMTGIANRRRLWTVIAYGPRQIAALTEVPTEDLCEEVEERSVIPSVLALTEWDRRAMRLLARLALGCCLAFDRASAGQPSIRQSMKAKRRGSKAPTILRYNLGRPVRVDARAYVKDYLGGARGARGPVTVQSLVRGHWKHQPHGVGGKDRKFIHVEPYWRGPEDAPIAVRPHVLGGAA